MGGSCAHCELPLGRRAVVGAAGDRFCCYGCLLARQVTRARGESALAGALIVRLGLALFFAMNVMMLSLPAYAPAVYGSAADGPLFVVLRVLAVLFTVPVLALLGGPVLASAWRAGGLNADALIALGTFAAWGLSAANTVAGRTEIYCDTAAMLLVLVTLGRWLEASARAEAGASVRATFAPAPALAVRLCGGERARVSPDALVAGDVVEVAPGHAFPTDGLVLDGVGGVDEAALTGESRPVVKEAGASVAGGTASVDGLFRIRVTAPAAASAAARIAKLADAARGERTLAERTADRLAARLVPAVVVTALVAAVWWTVHVGSGRGVLVGLAVLVVACPCALGLATPVAIWRGLAATTRRGVIVRSAPVLERLATIGDVLFDKTGTLTDGGPRLAAVDPVDGVGAEVVVERAAAMEAGLSHPLACAIARAADARGLTPPVATDVRALPGRGVCGLVEGEPTMVGSLALVEAELGRPVDRPSDAGTTIAVVAGGRLLGTLRFEETLRSTAGAAVEGLRALGLRVGLLTGDARADAVVPGLIPAGDAALGLLPDEKVGYVRARAAAGAGPVVMIGDGLNDAPALAAADVGIAVASATDLARLTADVVLIGSDLRQIPWLVTHARRVRRVIRQNLGWAFAYNAIAVGLAAAGALTPLVASLAMLASSLAVVANARRLAKGIAAGPPPTAGGEREALPPLTAPPGRAAVQVT